MKTKLEPFIWADEMIKNTEYLVKCDHATKSLLWNMYSSESLYKCYNHYRKGELMNVIDWKGVNEGYTKEISKYNKMPIMVCIHWAWLNNHLVGFYESTSLVTHYKILDDWVMKTFSHLNFYDRHCDVNNFMHCLKYVRGK